ncbi:MAG: AAA family ATPase [Candidatus Aminicenantes bacterium]|nr:AAA family ATPase [Candidatus Aminicenantes bacterium]
MKMKKLPVGISDFKDMVTGNYYYVDKTLFIKEIIDSGDKILLIPRPRRFGKTLNLSMLGYFYDCCPVAWDPDSDSQPGSPAKETRSPGTYKHLFDSLAICGAGQEYLDKIGRHPVIFLTFRLIKDMDWESCLDNIKKLIQKEYARHYYLLESQKLMPHERNYFQKIIDLTGNKGDYANSLENLLIFLSRYYNRRAVILIDEYDAPVHAGFTYGYYEEVINFMRNFLSGGLKDTDQYLEKGIVTGIMRIARESIFSGLNNPGVYTLLSEEFNDYFGFTETEIKTMLTDFQLLDMYEQVQLWYNGYLFGGKVIYNPWSIINFLNSKGKKLQPYWINTSDNRIVDSLLSRGGRELRKELEQLIRGEAIEKAIDQNIILKEVAIREDLLWSFLLMGGYLKQTDERRDSTSGKFLYTLSIPNEEVKITYTGIIDRYFSTKIENEKLEIMLKALIEGDIKLFEKMLRMVVMAVFSYHDFGGEPEKVYHALVAGLLIWISNTHEIKSNRESGYGRYDIMIIPKDITKIGYVIEFKSVDKDDNETVDTALDAAMKQIETKKYETELVDRGIKHIKKLAIAFSGKEVFVKE